MSQAELAELVGVSEQSVYMWEQRDGPLKLRDTSKSALLDLREIGVREARARLGEGV